MSKKEFEICKKLASEIDILENELKKKKYEFKQNAKSLTGPEFYQLV